jgi:uncharacterized membrane protein YphA (DoxX/SURF4 family)
LGFPGGLPGIALLLLRAVLAITLSVQGGYYLREPSPSPAAWFAGLVALASGAMLFAGFLTPLAGAAVGLWAIGIGSSLIPACSPTLFESYVPVILAATILFAVLIMGPGAFSLDARLFGRREIIIPPRSSARR